jgi:hypothetical protein
MYSGTFKPANPTTARKPGNDMKKNASIAKMGDSPAAWQKADKGLAFNGQDNGSSQRASADKGTANMSQGFSNPDSIQMRQAPNKTGNHSVTMGQRVPAATAGASKNPVASGMSMSASFGNPNMIQVKQMPNRKGNKE